MKVGRRLPCGAVRWRCHQVSAVAGRRRYVRLQCVLALILLLIPAVIAAQGRLPDSDRRDRINAFDNRRLAELDRLLLLENLSRAEIYLEELIRAGLPGRELLRRRIKLAQLMGEHQRAITLCREALRDQPQHPRLLRELAVSAMALADFATASESLRQLVTVSPDRRSALVVAVDLWRDLGHSSQALALCDSARVMLDDPAFLARLRAACLLDLGRWEEGTDELIGELRRNPLNLPLIRIELLERITTARTAKRIGERLVDRSDEPAGTPGERLLAVNLQALWGSVERARHYCAPLLENVDGSAALLQSISTLAVEAPLVAEPEQQRRVFQFLLEVLEELATRSVLATNLRPRVLDILAQVCEDALTANLLAEDPEAAVARLERVLALVKAGNPSSPHLYSARIRLAHFTRDVLGRPAEAAGSLERLLTDLDLPLEGISLARLTLGECYLAAGDTVRGRIVLTRLGRSGRFREAAGHAHFHLARLDLAQGHWETARDRFASVAMDNPRAGYANDALDLGLAVAEELDNPTGGPVLLTLYARSVYFDLTAAPDSQRTALEHFVSVAATQVDLSQPQYLLEKGRFGLAQLCWRLGDPDAALVQCERIVSDHPAGRYPAEALVLSGRIHESAERWETARQAYERLLVQYPDHLFADDIRDRIRSLP